MRPEEADRVRALIEALPNVGERTILNIGSSTDYFRRVMQPHVHESLIAPLEAKGFRFIHCDMKAAPGVDLVGDVLSEAFREKIAAEGASVVLCCNILEHLTDPLVFSRACGLIVPPGGYLIATVPYSYPHHKDPIDTGLRPSPAQIAMMFPELSLVEGEIVSSMTYLQESLRSKAEMSLLLKNFLKSLFPFYHPKKWRSRAHRFLWLFRPYKVSIAVLRRPDEAGI
ncbi:SAM-dependent methyltransferase [Sphingobium sp. B1D3A]|uniref:SAM-dependent methyltransferase n=2 Tax=Sphingobium lignivorans TaxID=2735886 RepID=A0ABR6NG94_9SPHN|nr:SAM-dependent methyltransferase [Sphingobium lignivorans]